MIYDTVIIGGGAAGIFSAIQRASSQTHVLLLEKSQKLLSKVKISGGGRCNLTHACFDPAELVKFYPRGNRELRGPFTRFQPKDTIEWFKSRGVEVKKEADGRMFPITDQSQTVIDCLLDSAKDVEIRYGANVKAIEKRPKGFMIHLKSEEMIEAKSIILATGGVSAGHALAQSLGHSIVEPIPSLFTFNVPNSPLETLSGVSVEFAKVSLPEYRKNYSGPLLITHWGFSGPAVLKLSAFCARQLHQSGYCTDCEIDWIPDRSIEQLRCILAKKKKNDGRQSVFKESPVSVPKSLWRLFASQSGVPEKCRWTHLSKSQEEKLLQRLKQDWYPISGKTTFKQEFVTCGGVKLSEVNFKTMESRLVPGLYFAGEVLDIDGITGGFNFQAAWTTGWIAGEENGTKCSQ